MGAVPSSEKVSKRTIGEKFKVEEFMGVWYDIAHIPNPYETDCEHSVITYSLISEDRIKIILRCKNYGNSPILYTGELTYADPNNPSKMRVRFDGLFSGWSNFWIYDTDYDSYAIAGNDSGYVWIMSRDDTMTFCRLWALRNRVKDLGFEVGRLKADLNLIRPCVE